LILWKGIYNFALSKKGIYSDEVKKEIGIKKDEEMDFYNEFWIDRKFKYVKYIGELEKHTTSQKYLNITKDKGRYNGENNNCEQNILFYGSSSLFGYNVKDNQTIPFHFKKFLNKNLNKKFCVFNYGSASHFSTHENIFFQNQFINKVISKNDILIFLDGTAENGNYNSKADLALENLFDYTHYNLMDKYLFTFPLTIKTLPIFQIFKIYQNKENNKLFNDDFEEIFYIFQSNINMRDELCSLLDLKCFTFLQPFPFITGKEDKSHLNIKNIQDKEEFWQKKYDILKSTKGVHDLNNSLKMNKKISFVDSIHYSPAASKIIAKNIFDKLSLFNIF
jgi:hypothetical protein